MVMEFESHLRQALRDRRYDEAVDVDWLLSGAVRPAPAHRDPQVSFGWSRRALPAAGSAALVAAVVALVVSISSAGLKPAQRRVITAGQPASSAVATSTTPSPGRPETSGLTRTFPWTPTWLPYGLDLRSDVVRGTDTDLLISLTQTGSGPSVSVQEADAKTLQNLDPWDHFTTTSVTVLNRPATMALAAGNRAGDRYLLFQPAQGHWLLVVARLQAGTPADATTVDRIAAGVIHTPLQVLAFALGTHTPGG